MNITVEMQSFSEVQGMRCIELSTVSGLCYAYFEKISSPMLNSKLCAFLDLK